jgi:steroid C-25 hydroxylase gamma subunit
MKAVCSRSTVLQEMLNPHARCWEKPLIVELDLAETPLSMQPTDAIRAQWKTRAHGVVKKLRFTAMHNGTIIGFRLDWDDPRENREILDNDQFADGAAVMLPAVADAPIILMGQRGQPVNAWYWRADEGATGRNISAQGYGSTRTIDRNSVVCSQKWHDGAWTVVITRHLRLDTKEPVAQLSPGDHMPYGVAVWEGGNQERAGIKSFTLSREDLFVDPLS